MLKPYDLTPLIELSTNANLKKWAETLPEIVQEKFDPSRNGDFAEWSEMFDQLPKLNISDYDLDRTAIRIGKESDASEEERELLRNLFMKMVPWRKGPYNLAGLHIDSEWRSDLKWDRLVKHISLLKNKTILDVGTGNGYHLWRMAGLGAKNVIGIDPYLRSVIQFMLIRNYLPLENVNLLPFGIEELPENMQAFDTVFSMGVLYHRRSPIDHLMQLKTLLQQGGELILETLVVEGEEGYSLVPEDRYARMANVWFIPSVPTLEQWMKRCGFKNIRCVDVTKTTAYEQRVTDWIQFRSLTDFLDSNDENKTIEGYPAPVRAIVIATR